MADRISYYWDACCFLSLIEGKSRWPNRVPFLELILERCEKNLCDIYTSEITISEVAFAKFEKDGKLLDQSTEKKIDALYSQVKMMEVSRFVAQDARSLIRTIISHPKAQEHPEGFSLRAMDAIHLASAKRKDLKDFHTYDEKLYKFDGMFGFRVGRAMADDIPLTLSSIPDRD